MPHRPYAMVRPAVVVSLLMAFLAMLVPTGASATQNDQGLIGETSYQSPQFGYSVTWTEPWDTRDRDVITNPGGFDTITLRGDAGTVRISGRADSYDPLTFLQDTIAIQLASGAELVNQDTTGAVPTAELLLGNEKMRIDVLSLSDAGAIVLVSLRADQRDFDAAFASAQEGIQLEGSALFGATSAPVSATADAPATQVPEPTAEILLPTDPSEPVSTQEVMSGVEGSTYTSPNFGFSVSWDPATWIVPDEAEYSEPDYDSLMLDSVTGPLWVSGANAYNGNASACLIGEETFYNDPELGISEWQVAVNADGNELTGETESSAWGVFTNVYTDPDDPAAEPLPFVDYIECHSLSNGESVVIFYSFADRETYNEHIGNVLAVVESLELSDAVNGQPATAEAPTVVSTSAADQPPQPTPTTIPDSPEPAPDEGTPDTDLTGGDTVTGRSHAYSFAVPPGWQVNESSLGDEVEVTSLTNGTSTVIVGARAMSPVNLSECVANIADEDESESAYADLALASTASGDAFAGEDDFTAFANFRFTGPDGELWAHFIECRWIVEGESVLVVTQDVPRELFGSERGARRQIQNSIELGG